MSSIYLFSTEIDRTELITIMSIVGVLKDAHLVECLQLFNEDS
jgi:hypothetical protein